jgi:hypothetical protein
MSTRPSLANYQQTSVPALASTAQTTPRKGSKKAAAAEEVIQTSFRLPRSRWKRLQELSIDQRASVQSIIISALEADFAKRGLKF